MRRKKSNPTSVAFFSNDSPSLRLGKLVRVLVRRCTCVYSRAPETILSPPPGTLSYIAHLTECTFWGRGARRTNQRQHRTCAREEWLGGRDAGQGGEVGLGGGVALGKVEKGRRLAVLSQRQAAPPSLAATVTQSPQVFTCCLTGWSRPSLGLVTGNTGKPKNDGSRPQQ